MLKNYSQLILKLILIVGLIISNYPFGINQVYAANTKIRQEINITNAYLGSASGAYATSSAIINIDTTAYTSATYYFEVVASTTSAVSSNIYLKNATTYATVATITFSNSNTYTLYRSNSFSPTAGSNNYVVVMGNEAVQKGALATRVVILQDAATLTNTKTQIEIGNEELNKNNVTTQPLTYPKYWYYDSSKWDGSPTFTAEVTYKDTQVASSTVYATAGTFTYVETRGTSYIQVEAWGAGGGGGTINASGGGGGGGGAYARSTTTPTGTNHTLVVGAGGTSDTAARAASSTYDTNVVGAQGGFGTANASIGTKGLAASSIGQVKYDGGDGGIGNTNGDVGGGGGGSGGPIGAGNVGADSVANATGGAGGSGNAGSGGTSGTGGTNAACASGGTGGAGGSSVLGGGGGGGSGNGTNGGGCAGGAAGAPGGGSGGGEVAGAGDGARGQIKIVETHGKVGIALEEDDGNYTWSFNKMIVVDGTATSTPTRVSVSFTPTTGKNYRIVASTTNASASYNIYNAKIVVTQTSPTLLEPQYLLSNNLLAAGTSLQKFLTSWASGEWSTSNTYIHEVSSNGGSSVVEVDTAGGTLVNGSSLTANTKRKQSSSMTMPADGNLDVKATTNNNDVYSSRILVQVTNVTVPGAPTSLTATGNYGRVNLTWVAPASNGGSAITGYKLYRDTTPTATTLIGTLGVVTSYWDGAITAGQIYYYRVVATNAIGDSAYSNESSATPTSGPASATRSSIIFRAPFMKFLGGRVLFR